MEIIIQENATIGITAFSYEAQKYRKRVFCSCGHTSKEILDSNYGGLEKCPHCHKEVNYHMRYHHGDRDLHIPFIQVYVDGNHEEFSAKKMYGYIDFLQDSASPENKIVIENTYEVNYNLRGDEIFEIKQNGVVLNPTQNNLKAALTYVNLSGAVSALRQEKKYSFEKSIFAEVYVVFRINSLYEITKLLRKYPALEVLYSTYGNLNMFKNVNVDDLGKVLKNHSKPNQILELPKPVCEKVFEMQKLKRPVDVMPVIGTIKAFQKAYGNELTIEFLDMIRGVAENTGMDSLDRVRVYSKETLSIMTRNLYNLVTKYNYQISRLKKYLISDVKMFQGIDSSKEALTLLIDYVNMCASINVPFEKYPRSLKLAHDVIKMNRKISVDEKTSQTFESVVNSDAYKRMAYSGSKTDKYCIICPETPLNLVEEGRYLHHCVASYINWVCEGESQIYFMRKKDAIEEPFITLDVRNNTVYQAAGFCERPLTSEESAFVEKWIKMNKLAA